MAAGLLVEYSVSLTTTRLGLLFSIALDSSRFQAVSLIAIDSNKNKSMLAILSKV